MIEPKIGDLWKTCSYMLMFKDKYSSLEEVPPNTLFLILDTENGGVKVYCNGLVRYFWKLRDCLFVCSGEDK